MRWKEMSISKKIAVGFGSILTLAVLSSILSLYGVERIIDKGSEAIEGNRLAGLMSEIELDILNWANGVNKILNDDTVIAMEIQVDDRKSKFGLWLYGEERKRAESLIPDLIPLLKEIEEPYQNLYRSVATIQAQFHRADDALPALLKAKEVDLLVWSYKLNDLFLRNLPVPEVEADEQKFVLGEWLYSEQARQATDHDPELAQLTDLIRKPHKRLHQSALDIQKTYKQVHPGLIDVLKDLLNSHRKSVQKVALAIIQGQSDLDIETDPLKSPFGKFMASEEADKYMKEFPFFKETIEAVREPHRRFYESLIPIQKALAGGDVRAVEHMFQILTLPAIDEIADRFQMAIEAEEQLVQAQRSALEIYRNETVPTLKEITDVLGKMTDRAEHLLSGKREARRIYTQETVPALRATQESMDKIRKVLSSDISRDDAMLKAARETKTYLFIMGIVVVTVGIFLAFIMGKGITRALMRASNRLEDASGQIDLASAQVASVSQQLAGRSSEQAASTEEISASLEEMASMTRQNADNALQANVIVTKSNEAVHQANSFMESLTTSMREISSASEQTSKIIKTIDEIAFQTNLLALNAAVEAARAGEAGAGFAVVADEVRNLSMRAAEAAKNTADLLEETNRKVNGGMELVTRAGGAFSEVTTSTTQVAELVREIAAASQEQAQGIEQISKAVAEMDKVVQSNAATAEESASTSAEMRTQAEQIKIIYNDLALLIGGKKNIFIRSGKKISGKHRTGNEEVSLSSASPRNLEDHRTEPGQEREVRPDQVIPLGEEDFKDF